MPKSTKKRKLAKLSFSIKDKPEIEHLIGGHVAEGPNGFMREVPPFQFSGNISVVSNPDLYKYLKETMDRVIDPARGSMEDYKDLKVTIKIGNKTFSGAHVNQLGEPNENVFTFGFS